MAYNPPDPRKNVLSVDQLRRVEAINERFAKSFRHLESPTPGPMKGEWPRDYEARLTSTLADTTLRALNRADRTSFSEDERALVKERDLVSSTRAIDAIGPDALRHIADRAHRVAAGLAADPSQGSFRDDGQTRVVERVADSGHRITEYFGSTGKWLEPFYHQGVSVKGGTLFDPPRNVRYVERPVAMPPQLAPQASITEMLRGIVSEAVSAAMPARRGARKA